jgi:hypothetical protein
MPYDSTLMHNVKPAPPPVAAPERSGDAATGGRAEVLVGLDCAESTEQRQLVAQSLHA